MSKVNYIDFKDHPVLFKLTQVFGYFLTAIRVKNRKTLPTLVLRDKFQTTESILYFAENQKNAEAYDEDLDNIGFNFDEPRYNQLDEPYRTRIETVPTRNPTKKGVETTLKFFIDNFSGLPDITNVDVVVEECYKDFCDGVSTSFDSPLRGDLYSRLFRVNIVLYPKKVDGYLIKIPDLTSIFSFEDVHTFSQKLLAAGITLDRISMVTNGVKKELYAHK